MKGKELEGQMNLFGSEPYQPKKAEGAEKPEVELDTEMEEFLSVGRKKKKKPEQEEEKPPEAASEKAAPAKKALEPKTLSGNRRVVMQRSFVDGDGNRATAAYLDYNLVYVEGVSGKAALTHYKSSKEAVDRYLSAIEEFGRTSGLKKTEEHPELRRVTVREDGEE